MSAEWSVKCGEELEMVSPPLMLAGIRCLRTAPENFLSEADFIALDRDEICAIIMRVA
jgi:hypothetical protein